MCMLCWWIWIQHIILNLFTYIFKQDIKYKFLILLTATRNIYVANKLGLNNTLLLLTQNKIY